MSQYVGNSREGGKTESFFTRNVRTITFLVTLGLFLVVFIPIAILEAKEYFGQDADARPQMQLTDVIRFSESPSGVTPAQLKAYACVELADMGEVYESFYEFQIEPHYRMLAVINNNTGNVTYLTISNVKTNEDADVLEDDIRAFIDRNGEN